MSSYATPQQLLQRHHPDLVNDLAADDGVRTSRIDLVADVNVLAALADASGAIEAALVAGNRYTVDQLTNLTGNSASLLARITCDIAMAFLFDRAASLDVEKCRKYKDQAEEHLNKLHDGQNVFNLESHKTAGNPSLGGPSAVDYARLNLIPDRTQHYYPDRASRLPTDRN